MLAWLLLALVTGSLVYCVLTIIAAIRYRAVRPPELRAAMPISVLKPLAGVDDGLEENLRTFFEQDYGEFEILFAVRKPDDPAIAVAERLRARYPGVPSQLIMTGEPPYANAKVYSLDLMLAAARHDLLVMSDSDIRVTREMLTTIAAEFQDPRLGLATCPYRAVPGHSFWNTLEAIGLNTEFLGGVLVARMLDGMKFALGPTIAARRSTLAGIGGFDAVKDFLAEDFVMGKLAAERGDGVILSSLRDRTPHRRAAARGEPAAPAALEPQHAAFASGGVCGTALHEPAAAGTDAAGGAAGVVACGGGGDYAACRRGVGNSGACAARRSNGTAVPAGSVTGSLELRDVGRRIFWEYDPVARKEILFAGGWKVRTGEVREAGGRPTGGYNSPDESSR